MVRVLRFNKRNSSSRLPTFHYVTSPRRCQARSHLRKSLFHSINCATMVVFMDSICARYLSKELGATKAWKCMTTLACLLRSIETLFDLDLVLWVRKAELTRRCSYKILQIKSAGFQDKNKLTLVALLSLKLSSMLQLGEIFPMSHIKHANVNSHVFTSRSHS